MVREILTRQALVTGLVTDRLTGRPLRSPFEVTVVSATGGPVTGAVVRALPDGAFVVHGDPLALPTAGLVLRLAVAADGYTTAQRLVELSAADLTRVDRDVTIAGTTTRTPVLALSATPVDIGIWPRPVRLAGRVARAEDPAVPVAGASVAVTAPAPVGPVLTDDDGFFVLGPIPVVATISLSISADGREPITPVVRLDHRAPVNQGSYVLEPS